MSRSLRLTYALVAYVGFLAVTVWSVAFLANVHLLTTIDGDRSRSAAVAVGVNLALLGVFALQHSVMARDRVKGLMRRAVPAAAERSTYVLVTDLLLALVLWQWRPVDGWVWHVQDQRWRVVLWVCFGLGWALAVSATYMIDHLDFVGLRQAASGRLTAGPFVERWAYAWVRHPLLLGLLIAFWATPDMSVGHLLFAGASTAYILVGLRLEERDLRRHLGQAYRDYAARTPALLPSVIPGVGRSGRR